MWGNLSPFLLMLSLQRPIPTCVGQPAVAATSHPRPAAYPHVCGATNKPLRKWNDLSGLSPRVWGNHYGFVWRDGKIGPIPTCVGQPRTAVFNPIRGGAYPHVCGATYGVPALNTRWEGLSPRVWGNQCV